MWVGGIPAGFASKAQMTTIFKQFGLVEVRAPPPHTARSAEHVVMVHRQIR